MQGPAVKLLLRWEGAGLGQEGNSPGQTGVVCFGVGGRAQQQDQRQARMEGSEGQNHGRGSVPLAGELLIHSGWCGLSPLLTFFFPYLSPFPHVAFLT